MDTWVVLLDILVLLSVALVLGIVCERLRQSPIIGYLAAGTMLGPNALGFVSSGAEVEMLAELGVALLLFTIGLGFSWRRLMDLGSAAIGGGVAQVAITLVAGAAVAAASGLSLRSAAAMGAVVALSSTACVLRLLVSRAEIESVHGRHALGVLLVQDAAVVPLVLLVAILGGEGDLADAGLAIAQALGGAVLLAALLLLLLTRLLPRLLHLEALRRNRDLPVLTAVVIGFGSAWASHELGLSPALGAFVAGMILGASPFAVQIRADIASVRTLLVTLFFGSIGMLGDPAWLVAHLPLVLGLVAAVIVGKTLIVWAVLRAFRLSHVHALAAGLCLAQIGEFSFILAATARGGLINDELFRLIISVTIVSLFATPYLVAAAPGAARWMVGGLRRARLIAESPAGDVQVETAPTDRILIIGFGPAGEAVGRALSRRSDAVTVLDLDHRAMARARDLELEPRLGDASHADVLRSAGIASTDTVIVTVPDPRVAVEIVRLIRSMNADVFIIARVRYHRHADELRVAGADATVNEEQLVGLRLAGHARRRLALKSRGGAGVERA